MIPDIQFKLTHTYKSHTCLLPRCVQSQVCSFHAALYKAEITEAKNHYGIHIAVNTFTYKTKWPSLINLIPIGPFSLESLVTFSELLLTLSRFTFNYYLRLSL